MKLEDKKILAEWMGYEFIDYLHVKDENGNYIADGREWMGDDDYHNFAKVWNKLKLGDRLNIETRMMEDEFSISDVLLNHLPRVMRLAMEAIKETK